MKSLILKPRDDRRVLSGHPWIFSNEINTKATPLKSFQAGECVIVKNAQGQTLGSAYVNPHTLLAARLYSRQDQALDHTIIKQKLQDALSLRQRLYQAPFYRLFFGDGDFLSGLIIDRFGDYFVIQTNTAGTDAIKNVITEIIIELFTPKGILFRNDSNYREIEGLPLEILTAYGDIPAEVEIVENDISFIVPLQGGQKTGWFYDQRNTRAKLAKYVKDLKVLDVFAYLGSFATYALHYGASEITTIDSSAFAAEYIAKNTQKRAKLITDDAADALKKLRDSKEQFDVVLVDPPAFIKKKNDFNQGVRAYQKVNHLALECLKPGGILFSSSCSMHLKDDDLKQVLNTAAVYAKCNLQLIDYGCQGEDHPLHPAIPETHYLKSFIARKVK